MTTATAPDSPTMLPRWSVSDVYESLDAREFVGAMESSRADVERAVARFDELGIGAIEPRPASAADGEATDAAISLYNDVARSIFQLASYIYASVSTDTRDERAQSLLSELESSESRLVPLLARLADWVRALHAGSGGPDQLAAVSAEAAEHAGPLLRLAARAEHQMPAGEEELYAALTPTGPSAWGRLHADVTSQLSTDVTFPDGRVERLPMPAVRGLATHTDAGVRQAAYEAELVAWPQVAVPCAAAMNAIKGDANAVNRRRHWDSPLDASLFANAVSRETFEAMQSAVRDSLADLRRWMRAKAALHARVSGADPAAGMRWADHVAPAPVRSAPVSWDDGLDVVREAFGSYGGPLGGIVDRAVSERWIDAEPRDGKVGGAFCMPFVGSRSLVLVNWSGSADSTQTVAHELGHAYHNTTLAERTALQRRVPMALAETASIFCETLVVERGLERLDGDDRLALLDVDLAGTNQVIVDIHSRFLFETEVYARRQQRTLGVGELNDLMLQAQADAYGDGLDQSTAHPYMWIVKSHYYGSSYYNWPYTYGLLFGLGLYARYRDDPERFRVGYETLLSRAGMDTAEQLGASFGLDVTDEAFWTASLDVVRRRIDDYEHLAATAAVVG